LSSSSVQGGQYHQQTGHAIACSIQAQQQRQMLVNKNVVISASASTSSLASVGKLTHQPSGNMSQYSSHHDIRQGQGGYPQQGGVLPNQMRQSLGGKQGYNGVPEKLTGDLQQDALLKQLFPGWF